MKLPTLIECDNIPKDKSEIPSPELVKKYVHLRDIANENSPFRQQSTNSPPDWSKRTKAHESQSLSEWTPWDSMELHGHINWQLVGLNADKPVLSQEFRRDAKTLVFEDFYVDDGLTSRSTPEENVSLIKNTQAMLATANLRLHKIASNSIEVMKSFQDQDRVDNLKDLHIEQGALPPQRSLGVMWSLKKDAFTFEITLPEKPYTCRSILPIVNSIYDCLGFAIPVTLEGRLLLRDLTRMENETRDNKSPLGWDDPLPQRLQQRWSRWKESLFELEDICIPTCYHPEAFGKTKRAEIHAFSDASDKAIGTAVYLRQENHEGVVSISLLFAQARLSPKQATTVPRLELCAAVLAVQAVKWITREIHLNIKSIAFYTNSKVMLGYISKGQLNSSCQGSPTARSGVDA